MCADLLKVFAINIRRAFACSSDTQCCAKQRCCQPTDLMVYVPQLFVLNVCYIER
jgi:hypothetical protein